MRGLSQHLVLEIENLFGIGIWQKRWLSAIPGDETKRIATETLNTVITISDEGRKTLPHCSREMRLVSASPSHS
jgi:hypothetical protein